MSTGWGGQVGIVGLGAMGRNLAHQAADRGYSVAVHDPWPQARAAWSASEDGVGPAHAELQDLVLRMDRPRTVLLLVQAGTVTGDHLERLGALLDPGDVVADLGNAHFRDTEARQRRLAERGVHLLGVGISGGAEGARTGASFMGGGDPEAWGRVAPLLETLSARADGRPCCRLLGPGGAGHYVKMVHNGIEYVEMQALSEAYLALREIRGLSLEEMAGTFDAWNGGVGASYLVGLTARVLRTRAPDGEALIARVLDDAGQKGTGRWAVESALELGVPVPTLAEAVFARALSGRWDARRRAARLLEGPAPSRVEADLTGPLEDAVLATRLCGFAQGFALLEAASEAYRWRLDLPAVAEVWRAGCILRGALLPVVARAFRADPRPPDLIAAPEVAAMLAGRQAGWRRAVAQAAEAGLPTPAFASALAVYDGLRARRLGADLISAQRDAFGAHRFRRNDRPGTFHADWSPS
jgi:6-phosphogluconate dehydrogenase